MGPALVMTLSRTLIRTYAEELVDQPDELLGITNQRIFQDVTGGMFITLFYGVLDPASGQLTYSNAGQTPPYLLDRQMLTSLDRTGMALGVSEEVRWEKKSLVIAPGASLVLYTDGVMDAQNRSGEMFGGERIRAFLLQNQDQPARQMRDALLNEIFEFNSTVSRVDDITLVVIKRE